MVGDGMRGVGEARDSESRVEHVAAVVVDVAYHLHRELGPGLLESVYETVLARMLEQRGLRVERYKLL